ncbi:efflux RND transporter permease subunit, partial [Bacteroidota bacterium]
MKRIIQFFVNFPIWERIIVVVVLLLGFYSLTNMGTSFFPENDPRIVSIQLIYPGAAPEEIEEGAVLKIENKLRGIAGIERISSESRENMANVTIEILRSYDVEELLQEVKNAVNSINSFPIGMEPPLIFKGKFMDVAITFSLSGDVDLKTLKQYGRLVEDDLRSIDGISQIELTGFPAEEIVVSVTEENLRRFNLRFDQVSDAVRAANIDLSAGNVKTSSEELLITFRNKEYYAEGFNDIIIKATPDGHVVRLKDIGTVEDRWAENPERSYVNGKSSVIVTIKKTIDEDIIGISDKVQDYVKEFNEKNDEIEATVISDRTKSLRQRMNLLTKNGGMGFFLVLLSLTFFINIRVAFWVSLSIPFSFAGMFILASFTGFTINVISLFGMILVVGILVDDGIIVGENIYRHFEMGKSPLRAAIDGVVEVYPSVFAAIVTTIIAFLPFFFIEGRMGENMVDMAFVVIATIAISLVESL